MLFNQTRILSIGLAIGFFLLTPLQLSLAEQPSKDLNMATSSEGRAVEHPENKIPIRLDIDKIIITKTQILLKSDLRKRYNGYKISLQNQTDTPLEIVSMDVTMGMSGKQAYDSSLQGSKGAMAGIIGGGVISGLLTFGIGFAVSLIIAPIYGGIRHSKNKKARQESLQFSKQPPSGTLNPGDVQDFITLVPLGSPAFVEATIKNSSTGQTVVVYK